jgi:hypothetical protein
MKGMKDEEYQSALNGLGLLEGEEIRLQYICKKITDQRGVTTTSMMFGTQSVPQINKGLLVFTNDNMIFMQQEGAWSKNYGQALRIPLEQISGIVISGGFLQIGVGVSGVAQQHKFGAFENDSGKPKGHEVRAEMETILTQAREEKKRIAQEALAKGAAPAMVFCRFCGTKNKPDQPKCTSCGATLT